MKKIKEKNVFAIIAIFIVSLFAYSDIIDDFIEPKDNKEVNNKTSSVTKNYVSKLNKEIKLLKQQQLKVILKMHELRLKLIDDDPELKKLHNKIMDLHKELGIKIDQNKEMRELIIKNISINEKIKQKELKNVKNKK